MYPYSLQKAAKALGITRPELIKRMRAKGLLNDRTLPAQPQQHRAYLFVHESSWPHPSLGMQYSQSTRIRRDALRWLAFELDMQPPAPPPPDRADVA